MFYPIIMFQNPIVTLTTAVIISCALLTARPLSADGLLPANCEPSTWSRISKTRFQIAEDQKNCLSRSEQSISDREGDMTYYNNRSGDLEFRDKIRPIKLIKANKIDNLLKIKVFQPSTRQAKKVDKIITIPGYQTISSE